MDIQTNGDYIKHVVHCPSGDHMLKNLGPLPRVGFFSDTFSVEAFGLFWGKVNFFPGFVIFFQVFAPKPPIFSRFSRSGPVFQVFKVFQVRWEPCTVAHETWQGNVSTCLCVSDTCVANFPFSVSVTNVQIRFAASAATIIVARFILHLKYSPFIFSNNEPFWRG